MTISDWMDWVEHKYDCLRVDYEFNRQSVLVPRDQRIELVAATCWYCDAHAGEVFSTYCPELQLEFHATMSVWFRSSFIILYINRTSKMPKVFRSKGPGISCLSF